VIGWLEATPPLFSEKNHAGNAACCGTNGKWQYM